MPRTKTISAHKETKPADTEKIVEIEEADVVAVDLDEKPGVGILPSSEPEEDELAEEDALLDTEELDPFGDTWEQ
jgi:hypothetical protein